MRARNYYVPDAWEALLNLRGWNNRQVAVACGFSDEHVANILNGVTTAARRNTRSKVYQGFAKLGANEVEIDRLFSDIPLAPKIKSSNGIMLQSQKPNNE